MIRPATTADVPRVVAMGLRFIADTGYRAVIVGKPEKMTALVLRLVEEPGGAIFVSATDDVLTGMIGLFIYEHPMSGERVASELFWWMEPDARGDGVRLYRHAERWARERGAQAIQMIAPTPQVAAVYRRMGFQAVEELYQRRLTE